MRNILPNISARLRMQSPVVPTTTTLFISVLCLCAMQNTNNTSSPPCRLMADVLRCYQIIHTWLSLAAEQPMTSGACSAIEHAQIVIRCSVLTITARAMSICLAFFVYQFDKD